MRFAPVLFVLSALPAMAQEAVVLRFAGETGAPLDLTSADFLSVQSTTNEDQSIVLFDLNEGASDALAELTGANTGQTMEVELCGEEFLSVTVQEQIAGGKGILPAPSEEFSQSMANVLRGDATCDVILAD